MKLLDEQIEAIVCGFVFAYDFVGPVGIALKKIKINYSCSVVALII